MAPRRRGSRKGRSSWLTDFCGFDYVYWLRLPLLASLSLCLRLRTSGCLPVLDVRKSLTLDLGSYDVNHRVEPIGRGGIAMGGSYD